MLTSTKTLRIDAVVQCLVHRISLGECDQALALLLAPEPLRDRAEEHVATNGKGIASFLCLI